MCLDNFKLQTDTPNFWCGAKEYVALGKCRYGAKEIYTQIMFKELKAEGNSTKNGVVNFRCGAKSR